MITWCLAHDGYVQPQFNAALQHLLIAADVMSFVAVLARNWYRQYTVQAQSVQLILRSHTIACVCSLQLWSVQGAFSLSQMGMLQGKTGWQPRQFRRVTL